MLSAILSDTLAFRSPTCTDKDRAAAEKLAGIAGVDIDEHALKMFEAGESLEGRTAEDIIFADYKVFEHDGVSFGVGQGSYMSAANLEEAARMTEADIDDLRKVEQVDIIFFLLTDIADGSSRLVYSGKDAPNVIEEAFGMEAEQGMILEGVVSRKKQFLPPVLNAIDEL